MGMLDRMDDIRTSGGYVSISRGITESSESSSIIEWAIRRTQSDPHWVKKYVKEIVPADKVTHKKQAIVRWW